MKGPDGKEYFAHRVAKVGFTPAAEFDEFGPEYEDNYVDPDEEVNPKHDFG
jgi:hypothetical protein